jgi:hypothetical protein
MIYQPHITAQILAAMESAEMGNNGYATMPLRGDVATALRAAGYVVIRNGLNNFTVYTARSWECFVAERNAEIRAIMNRSEGFDFEGAILARNAEHLFA